MYRVLKDFTTAAGYRAVVIVTDLGHRCGYVGIPSTHALFGVSYMDYEAMPDLSVHGGVTFSGQDADYPAPSTPQLHWFGFDCGHYADSLDMAELVKFAAEGSKTAAHQIAMEERFGSREGHTVRDTDYCVAECETLAAQLKEHDRVHQS